MEATNPQETPSCRDHMESPAARPSRANDYETLVQKIRLAISIRLRSEIPLVNSPCELPRIEAHAAINVHFPLDGIDELAVVTQQVVGQKRTKPVGAIWVYLKTSLPGHVGKVQHIQQKGSIARSRAHDHAKSVFVEDLNGFGSLSPCSDRSGFAERVSFQSIEHGGTEHSVRFGIMLRLGRDQVDGIGFRLRSANRDPTQPDGYRDDEQE